MVPIIDVAKMYSDNNTIPGILFLNFSPQDEQAIFLFFKSLVNQNYSLSL
jgi:hypothetical protein